MTPFEDSAFERWKRSEASEEDVRAAFDGLMQDLSDPGVLKNLDPGVASFFNLAVATMAEDLQRYESNRKRAEAGIPVR